MTDTAPLTALLESGSALVMVYPYGDWSEPPEYGVLAPNGAYTTHAGDTPLGDAIRKRFRDGRGAELAERFETRAHGDVWRILFWWRRDWSEE